MIIVYYRSWIYGSYTSLQGSNSDSKANGGTQAQAGEDSYVLWQLECLAHCKESNLSFKDEAHRCSISFCSWSSGGRKGRYAENPLHREPSSYPDKAN